MNSNLESNFAFFSSLIINFFFLSLLHIWLDSNAPTAFIWVFCLFCCNLARKTSPAGNCKLQVLWSWFINKKTHLWMCILWKDRKDLWCALLDLFLAHFQESIDIKCWKWKPKRRPRAYFMWAAWLGSTIGREMLSMKPHVSKPAGPISPCRVHGHARNAFCPRISQMSSWILITCLCALRPINLDERIK